MNSPVNTPIADEVIYDNIIVPSTQPEYIFTTTVYSGQIRNKTGRIDPFTNPEFYWIFRHIIDMEKQQKFFEDIEKEKEKEKNQFERTTENNRALLWIKNEYFDEEIFRKFNIEFDNKTIFNRPTGTILPRESKHITYKIMSKDRENSITFYGENEKNIIIMRCTGDYIPLINLLIEIKKEIEKQKKPIEINLFLEKPQIQGYTKNDVDNPLKNSENFNNYGSFKTENNILYPHPGLYKFIKFIPSEKSGGRKSRKSKKSRKSRKSKKSRNTRKSRK